MTCVTHRILPLQTLSSFPLGLQVSRLERSSRDLLLVPPIPSGTGGCFTRFRSATLKSPESAVAEHHSETSARRGSYARRSEEGRKRGGAEDSFPLRTLWWGLPVLPTGACGRSCHEEAGTVEHARADGIRRRRHPPHQSRSRVHLLRFQSRSRRRRNARSRIVARDGASPVMDVVIVVVVVAAVTVVFRVESSQLGHLDERLPAAPGGVSPTWSPR